MIPVPIAHLEGVVPSPTGGNPLYDVSVGHEVALVALAVLPLGAWVVHARSARDPFARRLVEGYRALPAVRQLLVWLLLVSAAVHLALVVGGHGDGLAGPAFAAATALLALAAWRLLEGSPWRLLSALVLFGSITAYWIAVISGEPPDQVGLATKVVEILGLAIVLRSGPRSRFRATAASGVIVGLVLATAATGWIGAFAAAGAGQGHHGPVPPPGTVMPTIPAREPTLTERAAARDLLRSTAAALARYADPTVAAADGYATDGLAGLDFHAGNAKHEADGRTLDPTRPEALVYAAGPSGPVLLGAVFQVSRLGDAGPAVGGPLTVWHAHEHVCVSLTPPGLVGLLSPLGGCPFGSIDIPRTAEMIHVWTVQGAPEPFGDLSDDWRRRYLATLQD